MIDISEIEPTSPAAWSIMTDRLVKVLKAERHRLERIERYNSRKSENK
ncbi:MAG: hypothetical protein JSS81_26800 [Acidobacteria bacterium]|nr:hypothetical protein [Acidobacteriota bacterium]